MIQTSIRLISISGAWPRAPRALPSCTLPELEDKVDALHGEMQQAEALAATATGAARTWTRVFKTSAVGMVAGMAACAAYPPLGIGLWATSAVGFAAGGWLSQKHEHAADEHKTRVADCGRALTRYEEELDTRRRTLAEAERAREREAQARAAADQALLEKMAAPPSADSPSVVVSPREVRVAGVTVPRNILG